MATPHSKAEQEAQAVSFAQLEPSKENIQPLLRSTGKRMKSLAQNLRQTPKALTQKQERERLQWEHAIKSDKSQDPLNLWLQYIKWVKLNFSCPTNQKAQLLRLIERCTSSFKDDARYTNNKHYIKLWLEYAHLSRDSMEIFKFLHANKIGAQLALFWRGWAIVAEQQNQFDLVDRIFNEAKQIGAQPLKDIHRSYEQFSARMRKKIHNNDIELQPNIHHTSYPNNTNTRATLGQISAHSSSHRKDHIQPHGFGTQIAMKQHHTKPQIGDINQDNRGKQRKFGVYREQETQRVSSSLPPAKSTWQKLGTGYNRSKENNGIASAWNHQHFNMENKPRMQQRHDTHNFAIPTDDALRDGNTIRTHERPAMGEWKQQGRYMCASFYDPNALQYDGAQCSFEEARCRVMKGKWNKELEEKERSESMMMEEDDMMMTMNVGRILYNKNCPDLSIPSTINEEPQSLKSTINTDKHAQKHRNRKRRSSDDEDLPENEELKPNKKRFKFGILNGIHGMDEDRTYDVFSELTTTTNLTSNTIGSHFETPLRKLDFATPSQRALMDRNNGMSMETTQDIGSMTEFFKNPIKITDKRMGDTPTVTHIKARMVNPTQTITFHSKAAMNDIVKIFGANDGDMEEPSDEIMVHKEETHQENDTFGIYEDTATIHTKIDMGQIQIQDDEVASVHRLSIQPNENVSELPLPLPMIAESANEDEEEQEEVKKSVMDPLDEERMKQHELSLIRRYHSCSDVMDERHSAPPITVESLLNGETDIELDDEDAYLNVTEYIKHLSKDEHHVFVVNDLSQEDDTERMLLVDCPCSLRSYHISQVLAQDRTSSEHMEYALVQSVYLYHNSSFTLSKITDTFEPLSNVVAQSSQSNTDLHEKLLLYFMTEMIRIVSQLHAKNIIHSNLKLHSFLLKLPECNSIRMDWSDHVPPINGWQNFGLLLHDIHECIKLDDFIDMEHVDNASSFGCLIQGNDTKENTNHITHRFQQWIENKTYCYEVDVFGILLIMIQLLTQENDGHIISKIDCDEDIIKQLDSYRQEKGLKELQNKELWNKVLNMLLMKQENDSNIAYSFDTMSITNRQNYLKQCYEYCAAQLMDLENFTPKLQMILARLDQIIE